MCEVPIGSRRREHPLTALEELAGAELDKLAGVVSKNVGKALEQLGLGGDNAVPTVAEAELKLASLVARSIASPRDWLVDPALARPAGEAGTRGLHGGFNLHPGTTVGAHDAAARERLCQYLLCPPIPEDQRARPAGRRELPTTCSGARIT